MPAAVRMPALLGAAVIVAALLALAIVPATHAGSPQVSVFPIPGTRYNQPQTQITFRGIPAGQIGNVAVVGSKSGVHTGVIEADSDGNGGSFVPSAAFKPGETVTVKTARNVLNGKSGTFQFAIAHPAGLIPYAREPYGPSSRHGAHTYQSVPGFHPPAVAVSVNRARATQGDMFVTPGLGPQGGPLILDRRGQPVWFLPFPGAGETRVADLRVQHLYGQSVLTWWQGNSHAGNGRGVGMIYNHQYQPVADVTAANGLDMDFHEFLVTRQGDAYFTASWPVRYRGIKVPLIDPTVQEVDIKTGLVLFQWDALAHVPLQPSYTPPKTGYYDPYHINSISIDTDGNLVISMRTKSSVYKVDHRSGRVLWTLGGRASSFNVSSAASFVGQHDVVVHRGGRLTLFDNENGPPRAKPTSRAVVLSVDTKNMTVKLVKQYLHTPGVGSDWEGSLQPLSHGDVFIGWGSQRYFSEDDAAGRQIFNARFIDPNSSYRAYRFVWHGDPQTLPALAATTNAGKTVVYASWNGATDVARWQVLAGASATALAPAGSAARRGFETRITITAQPYVAVQALDSSGHVLATSSTVASRNLATRTRSMLAR